MDCLVNKLEEKLTFSNKSLKYCKRKSVILNYNDNKGKKNKNEFILG